MIIQYIFLKTIFYNKNFIYIIKINFKRLLYFITLSFLIYYSKNQVLYIYILYIITIFFIINNYDIHSTM